MLRKTLPILALAAAAAAWGQEGERSTLVGASFGAGSYESFGLAAAERLSSYNVGFRFGADFYRNDGRFTHLVSFDFAPIEDYFGGPIKIFDFDYNVPIYFTSGPLRPAVRPFFGARFASGASGGSQGLLGILGGVRFKPSPTKCIFSDVYVGWQGRFHALRFETAFEPDGWKSSFAFRNANTIEIVVPLCIYITAAVDYDFAKVSPATRDDEPGTRKPVFSGGFGPAFTF
jgi:hypothetical protein